MTIKKLVLQLREGPKLRIHYRSGGEEKKKAQHQAGFEPMTSRVLLHRHALYCCATTAALFHAWDYSKASFCFIKMSPKSHFIPETDCRCRLFIGQFGFDSIFIRNFQAWWWSHVEPFFQWIDFHWEDELSSHIKDLRANQVRIHSRVFGVRIPALVIFFQLCYIFSLLLSSWTVEKSNPSGA